VRVAPPACRSPGNRRGTDHRLTTGIAVMATPKLGGAATP
jgi:hypothetical protein